MLDIECFTYLNRALESQIAPVVVLASNRGLCTIRGTGDITSAHGIPPDFLARLLIIPTYPYSEEEIKVIARLRAKTEGVQISDDALAQLAKQGLTTSLRYALQLLSPASIVSRINGRQMIEAGDIEECKDLFIDAKRSAARTRDLSTNFIV